MSNEGQFGPTLIFTPFNYAEEKVYGAELTANYQRDNLSAYFNLARSTAKGKDIISSQYQIDPTALACIADHWIYLAISLGRPRAGLPISGMAPPTA